MFFWVFFGVMKLIILSYQDIKNDMLVDGRYNYYMFGATTALLLVYQGGIIYLLSLILITSFLMSYLSHIKKIGSADAKTLSWIFIGLGMINWTLIFYFMGVLLALYGFSMTLLKNVMQSNNRSFYGYPIILCAFIIIAYLFRGLFEYTCLPG